MSTKILVQARSSSTRFPGKIYEKIGELSVLEHVFEKCNSVADTIIIIPYGDDRLHEYCISHRMPYFEGPLNDLVGRYYEAALTFRCDNVVRITSDCPMLDTPTLEYMISMHEEGKYEFTTNFKTCVDGHDIDIYSMNLLEYLNLTSTEREHIGLDIKKNIKDYMGSIKILNYNQLYLKSWFPKLSIDTPADLEVVRNFYKELYA